MKRLLDQGVWLTWVAALFRILELSHEALVTGIVTTKRLLHLWICCFLIRAKSFPVALLRAFELSRPFTI